jgi:hypothetical protein
MAVVRMAVVRMAVVRMAGRPRTVLASGLSHAR